MTHDDCLRAAVWLNRALFSNKLEQHRVELVNVRDIAGCYVHNHRGGRPAIRLNSEYVRGAVTARQITDVLCTLTHEQTHMSAWLLGDTGHGMIWQLRMFAVGLRPIPDSNGGYGDKPIPDSPFSEAAEWISARLARA